MQNNERFQVRQGHESILPKKIQFNRNVCRFKTLEQF